MAADPVRVRRCADHRRTLGSIAWKYRANSPWRNLFDELDSFQTAHKRLIGWTVDDTWGLIPTDEISHDRPLGIAHVRAGPAAPGQQAGRPWSRTCGRVSQVALTRQHHPIEYRLPPPPSPWSRRRGRCAC